MADEATRALGKLPGELQDGRFRIEGLIGTGGMAVVAEAHDTLLHRRVAIKFLSNTHAVDAEGRERFEREARAMAGLTHPNLVTVHDVGDDDGRPYFIMERIDGGDLAERLGTEGPLPPDEARDVMDQALAGLAHAHANGLFHRDIKPRNLLRTTEGTVKIADFGVAQAIESATLTRTGIVLGTMRYLAPERLRGADSTATTDLYALAATVVELLTGEGHDHKEAGELPLLPPGTAPELRALLEACLDEDPERRPASADVARAMLTRPATRRLPVGDTALATTVDLDAPTEAHDLGAPRTRPSASPARRRRAVGALAAVAIAAALGAAVSSSGDDAPEGEIPTIAPADDPAQLARNTAQWLRELNSEE